MKKLILIQNDYPSTGKSTLAHCCARYLNQYGAPYQLVSLVEEAPRGASDRVYDANTLTSESLLDLLDESPITLLEVATGMGDFFEKLYQNDQLDLVFQEASVSLSIVIPVTSDHDSFDAVLEAAEVYSDNAEYTIAHLITSSYEDDDKVWDTSYASRVMDMFEAVELYIPEIGFQLEMELRSQHASLNQALLDAEADEHFGKDFTKWINRVMNQVDSARQYLFGDAFRPTTAPKPVKRTRGRAKAI
ncbi:MAG: hypothetical protein OJI67_21745 [Prosthecobacter sp.]|nr:hypothetical protein [Prosthecobacter sp.]